VGTRIIQLVRYCAINPMGNPRGDRASVDVTLICGRVARITVTADEEEALHGEMSRVGYAELNCTITQTTFDLNNLFFESLHQPSTLAHNRAE
jgi:hypothetical protein